MTLTLCVYVRKQVKGTFSSNPVIENNTRNHGNCTTLAVASESLERGIRVKNAQQTLKTITNKTKTCLCNNSKKITILFKRYFSQHFTVSTNHRGGVVKERSQVAEKQEIWARIYLTTDSLGYFSAPNKSAQTGNN